MNFTIKKIHYYNYDKLEIMDVEIPVDDYVNTIDISECYEEYQYKPQNVCIWFKPLFENICDCHCITYDRSKGFLINSIDVSFDDSYKLYNIDISDEYWGPINIEIHDQLELRYGEYIRNTQCE